MIGLAVVPVISTPPVPALTDSTTPVGYGGMLMIGSDAVPVTVTPPVPWPTLRTTPVTDKIGSESGPLTSIVSLPYTFVTPACAVAFTTGKASEPVILTLLPARTCCTYPVGVELASGGNVRARGVPLNSSCSWFPGTAGGDAAGYGARLTAGPIGVNADPRDPVGVDLYHGCRDTRSW